MSEDINLIKIAGNFILKDRIPGPPQGLFQQFWEKAPCQNWEKVINLLNRKIGRN